jgi:hypothetical protein
MAGPVRLYDRDKKEWIEVPETELNQKVASGKYAFGQGIDIPVVAPDGELGYVPSEKAEEAFAQGFRWQTPQDREADTAKKKQQIIEQNYGDAAGTSFLQGVASGATFGGSDVVLNKLGLADAAKQVKDLNPASNVAGNVVGAIANPVMGAAGNAVKAGGAALGETSAAIRAGEALASRGFSTAGKIVQNTLPNITGSAVEGAFYGLGQGVSEAALGEPSKIVENLASNAAMGGIFGGMLGGAFGGLSDASPLIKDIAKATWSKADELVQSAAQKATKSTLLPVLRSSGKDEEARLLEQLIPNAADRAAALENPNAIKEVSKMAATAEKEVQGRIKDLDGNVRSYLKRLPKEEADAIEQEIVANRGDLTASLNTLYKKHQDMDGVFKEQLAVMKDPPQVIGRLYDDTEALIKRLEKAGDAKSADLAARIQNIVDSEVPKRFGALQGRERDATLSASMKLADEVRLANRLRQEVPVKDTGLGGFAERSRKDLINYRKNIDDYALKNHPIDFVAQNQSQLDQQYTAYSQLRQFASGRKGEAGSKVLRVMQDPEKAQQFDKLMGNITAFAPEIEQVQAGFKSAADRMSTLRTARDKINELLADAPGGKLTTDNVEEMLQLFKAPEKFSSRISELRSLQEQLAATEGVSAVEKYIRIQKALGADVIPTIDELKRLEPTYEALNRLKPQGGSVEPAVNAKGIALGFLHPALSALYTAGKTVSNMGNNPYRVMQTLTAIEKASNKAAKRMESLTNAAVDSLTSKKAQKVSLVSGVAYERMAKSSEDREEQYKKQKRILADMQQPEFAHEYIAQRMGQWSGAPMVQAQMGVHMLQVAQFLSTKMPVDPLEGKSMFGNDTGWSPSDADLSKFNRYVAAAQNPGIVLEHIQRGSVVPEEIETLKTLYPATFQKLQSAVLDGITKNGNKLSYQQRLTIGTLFDVPTDATMAPDFIASMQSNYQQANEDQGGRPEGKSIKIDINPNETFATETTRITNK